MDRGPAALFGAIVAVGLGPAMWLGVRLGAVEVAPSIPPAVVGEHTSVPDRLVGGTGAGDDSPLGEVPDVAATPRGKVLPITDKPSPSATSSAPSPSATTSATPSREPSNHPQSTAPTESTTSTPTTPATDPTSQPTVAPDPPAVSGSSGSVAPVEDRVGDTGGVAAGSVVG